MELLAIEARAPAHRNDGVGNSLFRGAGIVLLMTAMMLGAACVGKTGGAVSPKVSGPSGSGGGGRVDAPPAMSLEEATARFHYLERTRRESVEPASAAQIEEMMMTGIATQVAQICEEFVSEADNSNQANKKRIPLEYYFYAYGFEKAPPYKFFHPQSATSLQGKAQTAADRAKTNFTNGGTDRRRPQQPMPEAAGSLWLMRSERVVGMVGIAVRRTDWNGRTPPENPAAFYDAFANGIVRTALERYRRPPRELDRKDSIPTLAHALEIIDAMIDSEAPEPQNNGPAAYAVCDQYGEIIATGGELSYSKFAIDEAKTLAIRGFENGDDSNLGQTQLRDWNADEPWQDGGVGAYNLNQSDPDYGLAVAGYTKYEDIHNGP